MVRYGIIISLKNNTFLIFGKGSKERTGYLNKVTKDALLKYLEVRNLTAEYSKLSDVSFDAYKGEVLGVAGLDGEWSDCAER